MALGQIPRSAERISSCYYNRRRRVVAVTIVNTVVHGQLDMQLADELTRTL